MDQLGKPSRKLMTDVIGKFTGSPSTRVIVGPKPGIDVSVLRIDRNRVMIVSGDPVSLIPSMGPQASAIMSVYEIASDVATSGVAPEYAMVDLNLPPHMSNRDLSLYWRSFHEACLKLGLSIIGGHTGRFEGCDYSVIGSATLWSFSRHTEYLTSSMAEDGDDLIVTKSAGFGATSVLTSAFPRIARKTLGSKLFEKAKNHLQNANTVNDAITAAGTGIHKRGVTAMHDATEGGIVSAILELTGASGLGANVWIDEIPILEETREICRLFRIDPLVSLGEGSLVIACKPHRSKAVIDRLRSKLINATIVGRLSAKTQVVYGVRGKERTKLEYPSGDPYWKAYWNGVRKGWA